MDINEFKDRLFDTINEADNLPIQDVVSEDKKNMIHVFLEDGSAFSVYVKDIEG